MLARWLLRELEEEVTPLPDAAELSFLGAFEIWVPSARTGYRDVHIVNFIYARALSHQRHTLLEGDAWWSDWDALSTEPLPWCWGYDHILADCAPRLGRTWSAPVDPAVTCVRKSDPERAYSEMQLDSLRLNPLVTGDLAEDAPLR